MVLEDARMPKRLRSQTLLIAIIAVVADSLLQVRALHRFTVAKLLGTRKWIRLHQVRRRRCARC